MGDYLPLGAHKFSQFPILPSWFSVSTLVLHSSNWLSYFEDKSKWDPLITIRACVHLKHLYEIYKEDGPVSDTAAPHAQNPTLSVFMDAIKIITLSLSRAIMEIKAFFSGTYPCTDGNALKWWKVCARILYLQPTFNNFSCAALCQALPCASSHCSWHSCHPRSQHISWVSLFKQQTHTLRCVVLIISWVCFKDCCCQRMVEEGFRGRGELSWWYLYSLLIQLQYWYLLNTIRSHYLVNTICSVACSIWYNYNIIWQKMYCICIWTALVATYLWTWRNLEWPAYSEPVWIRMDGAFLKVDY